MRGGRSLLGLSLLLAAAALAGPIALPARAGQEPAADWRDRFAAALAAFRGGTWDAAARGFADLDGAATPIPEYALLFRAESLAQLGQPDAARETALRSVDKAPDGRQVPRALLLAADQAARSGDAAAAAGFYRRFLDRASDHPEAIRARYALGEALAQAGQAAEAVGVFRQIWIRTPASPQAGPAFQAQQRLIGEQGLSIPPLSARERLERAEQLLAAGRTTEARGEADALVAEGPPTELTLRALRVVTEAWRRLDRYDQAARAVDRAIPLAPPERRGWWLLEFARLHQRKARDVALATVERIRREYPKSPEAAEALLFKARLLEGVPSLPEAERAYLDVAAEFSDRDEAGAALWRSGWLAWLGGSVQPASERWGRLLQVKGGQAYREAAAYWVGRIHLERGESEGAERHFASLVTEVPRSYYGILAANRLARRDSEPRGAARLTVSFPQEPIDLVRGEPRFAKSLALRSVGLDEFADAEMEELTRRSNGDAARLYAVSAALAQDARYHLALRILRREFYGVARGGHPGIPRGFWELFYPMGWRPELTAAASRAALDPLLVAAVVREESSFDPQARSRAGARGLMQLMPETARPMVRERGLPFRGGDILEEPEVNLQIGATFLGKLVRDFGDPRLAVAAYNAGPARVREWWSGRRSDDLEVFVEQIPFNETRGFVKRVMLSWEEYRRLYGKL